MRNARDVQVLDAIREWWSTKRYRPVNADIEVVTGWPRRSVEESVNVLIEHGYVRRGEPGTKSKRGLYLTRAVDDASYLGIELKVTQENFETAIRRSAKLMLKRMRKEATAHRCYGLAGEIDEALERLS